MDAVEVIRKRFRPERITTLFVGESAPHSGDFFYSGNTAMLRHMGVHIAAGGHRQEGIITIVPCVKARLKTIYPSFRFLNFVGQITILLRYYRRAKGVCENLARRPAFRRCACRGQPHKQRGCCPKSANRQRRDRAGPRRTERNPPSKQCRQTKNV